MHRMSRLRHPLTSLRPSLLRTTRHATTGLPTREELHRLSVKELKKLALRRQMTTDDCVEKAQIIDKILGEEVKMGKDMPTRGKGGVLSTVEMRVAAVVCVVLAWYIWGKVKRSLFDPPHIRELRALVAEGDIPAHVTLAKALYAGEGGIEVDYAESFRLLRIGADAGNADAQCELGGLYCRGEGTEQDHALGYTLFLISAQQGNTNAMYNVAKLLEVCQKKGYFFSTA